MTRHADRIVLITGATRGIGHACAQRLLAEGATVLITGRSAQGAKATAEALCGNDGRAVGFGFDQSDSSAPAALMRAIQMDFGQLDGLVANVGVHRAGRLGMITDSAINDVFATNSMGLLRLVQSSIRLLRKGTQPAVVLMGSMMGSDGAAGQSAYAMSKAAVEGLVVPASRELAAIGARVNAVSPGYVQTDMTNDLTDVDRSTVIASTTLGRMAEPSEIASVMSFLLSGDSSFITGQVIRVDGGFRG